MRFILLLASILISLPTKAQYYGLDRAVIVDAQFKAAMASYSHRKYYESLPEIEFDEHITVDNCPDYLKAISNSRKITGYRYLSRIWYALCIIDHAVLHSSGLETIIHFPEGRGNVLVKRMDMTTMVELERPEVMPEVATLENMFPDRASGYENTATSWGEYRSDSLNEDWSNEFYIVAIVDVNHNGKEDWVIRYETRVDWSYTHRMSGAKIILDVTETGLLTPIDYMPQDYEQHDQ